MSNTKQQAHLRVADVKVGLTIVAVMMPIPAFLILGPVMFNGIWQFVVLVMFALLVGFCRKHSVRDNEPLQGKLVVAFTAHFMFFILMWTQTLSVPVPGAIPIICAAMGFVLMIYSV